MPAATKDAVLGSAVDLAREVAIELAEDPADVGEYLGLVVEGERLVSHRFASAARGYRGWEWTVTVARVPRSRTATVCEAELLPGPDAILGRAWLPWSERIRPGDIGPGDVLPFKADDPRLEPGWTPTGDPELDDVAIDELALARVRVLSPQGRDEAAERWYRGPHGPTSAGALASAAACGSCGFLVPLQGSLGTVFGVCANQWSPDDGTVVSVDHGCGAHSETDAEAPPTEWPAADPLIDELSLELVQLSTPAHQVDPRTTADDVAPHEAGGDEDALEAAADEAPVDAAADSAPADETAADSAPADEAVADKADVDAPVDEAVADSAPAAEVAADNAPVDQAVADNAPVDDAPVDARAAEAQTPEIAPDSTHGPEQDPAADTATAPQGDPVSDGLAAAETDDETDDQTDDPSDDADPASARPDPEP